MALNPAPSKTETAVEMAGVHKWYGEFHVLRDINLKVRTGERIVVCGPSGSGKSTMIRCINRLEEHQKGQIIVDNVELTNDLKKIDVVRREVGMVFQHFNLFPHKSVLDNITLAPILTLWLGFGLAPKVAMVVLIVFVPVAQALHDGLVAPPLAQLDVAQTMGAGRWSELRHLRFPAALPRLASGLRLGAIYAPVGAHRDLLAYLVRRLLENGANSSFVHQIVDEAVTPAEIARDPLAAVGSARAPAGLAAPQALFGDGRRNSMGFDLADEQTLARIEAARSVSVPDAGPLTVSPPTGAQRPVLNPATQEVVAQVTEADPETVARAIGA